MYCVALDPGGTTGFAIIPNERTPWHIEVLQLGPEEHHAQLFRQLTIWKPTILLVESFENTGQVAADLAAREYIGICKAYAQAARDCTPHSQHAATAKAFWNDEKLRDYGLYVPRQRHARDAIRHYLYYRTFKCADQSLLKRESTGQIRLAA